MMRRNKTPLTFLTLLFTSILLSVCTPPFGTQIQPTPAPTIILNDALRQDADAVAEDLGISVEEAIHRLNLQDSIGALGAKLEQQEAETFAGLWILQEPEYRIVVAFTRNGQETIKPYIENTSLAEFVEFCVAQVSLVELKTIQQSVKQMVNELDFPFSSSINVKKNQVELYVTDIELWEASTQETGIQLPEHVEVIATYVPLGDEIPFAITPVLGLFLPQLRVRSANFMTALLQGKLIVIEGCLRVCAGNNGDGHLIIWQPDYFLNDHNGKIEILDRDGQVVAVVGETIRIGGGEMPMTPEFETQLREPVPDQCAGPYWLMGEVVPETTTPTVLATPGSQETATGTCTKADGEQVTVTLCAEVPDPRYTRVTPDQILNVVNQREEEILVRIGPFELNIPPGGEHLFDTRFGEYLTLAFITLDITAVNSGSKINSHSAGRGNYSVQSMKTHSQALA